jgi:hypothetical protein
MVVQVGLLGAQRRIFCVSSTVLSGIKHFVPEYTRVKYGTGCLLRNVLEYKPAVRTVP